MTEKQANERVKNDVLAEIWQLFTEKGEDNQRVASGEMSFPRVNENGTDIFVNIKVSIPSGSRDGTPYDAYELADEYRRKLAEKEEKAKAQAEAKAKKIAKDKANREKLAKSKAEHTAQQRKGWE